MAKAESQNKIRQIAIVLTSVDAKTARQILSSLPPDIAKPIRSLIGRLGSVTPHERDEAFAALTPILKLSSNKPATKPRDSGSKPPAPSYASPAEMLLAQSASTIDRADITYSMPVGVSGAETASPQISDLNGQHSPPSADIAWFDATTSEWAQLLKSERPIIIASIVAQAPKMLASEILQELPGRIAVETLAEMPKIGSTSPEVLEEICSQLNGRLREFRNQSLTNQWGLQKARGIFESLPEAMRSQWALQMESIDPNVAREFAQFADVAKRESGPEVSAGISATYDVLASSAKSQLAPELKIAEQTRNSSPDNPDKSVSDDSVASSSNTVAYDAEDFDSLMHLPLSDLAKIIRECDPETVLAALSGASRRFLARFEKMIHPREVNRLRERIKSNTRLSMREIDAAQAAVVATAAKLGLFSIASSELMAA